MRYGSICSGIEAATVAWHPLGWEPVFFSEIDPFARAVLSHHYPDVPLRGDFTLMNGDEHGPIQLLVGGTPCQSFSIAGLRGGMADDRGNLALEFCRLAKRARPKWIVWENVPGVLSSGRGRDFGSILGALVELGYGVAWRILDAQYVRVDDFGRAVPQRRRRVFVVGCLGDWRGATAVLFERSSLSRDTPPRRKAGQGIARPITPGSPGGSGYRNDADTADNLIAASLVGYGEFTETLPTLRAKSGDQGGGSETLIAFDTTQITSKTNCCQPQPGDPCHPLAAGAHPPAIATQWAVRRLLPVECEKLQGFPPGYTDVPYRGKPAADGPRYKALGNSMAVNVMRWIGRRIEAVEALSRPVLVVVRRPPIAAPVWRMTGGRVPGRNLFGIPARS